MDKRRNRNTELTNNTLAGTTCNPWRIEPQKVVGVEDQQILEYVNGLVQREVEKALASLPFFNNALLNSRRFITAKEAAQMLKISHLTVLEYLKSGDIPAVKIGTTYRIDNDDMIRFLDQRKKYNAISIKTKIRRA
jgi:excisionase family DNA binding protein